MSPTLTAGTDTFATTGEATLAHNGLSYLTVAKDAALAYVYFPFTGVPDGATLTSATLRLYTQGSWAITPTVTVRALSETWGASTLTWDNRPTPTGSSVSDSHASASDGDVFTFDVTTQVDAMGSTDNYGFVVARTDVGAAQRFRSNDDLDFPPSLELVWAVTPGPPTGLSPSGGRAVATPTPPITFDAEDVTAVQVQIDASAGDFTSPEFDSGVVATLEPELNLADTAYAGMPAATDKAYRVQYRNSAGVWSGYSDIEHMMYRAYSTITSVNPSPGAGGVVTTNTPTLSATSSGTVVSYTVTVAASDDPTLTTYTDSLTDSVIESTLPVGIINDSSDMILTFEVYDEFEREAVAGFPVAATLTQTFSFQDTSAIPPPSDMYVEQVGRSPFNRIRWTRNVTPGKWVIRRDRQIITDIKADDLVADEDGYWSWIDYTAAGNALHHYRVSAKLGQQVSAGGPTFDLLTNPRGLWVADPFSEKHVELMGTDSGSWQLGETGSTYYPLLGPDATHVTQNQRGYEGSLSGLIYDETQHQVLRAIRRFPTREYVIATPYLSFKASVFNVNVTPTPTPYQSWNASLDFLQQGTILWEGAGDAVGSEAILTGTFDYEEGVNNAAVTTASPGVISVSGGPLYKTAAALHGTMGWKCPAAASGGIVAYAAAYVGQVSVYFTPRASSGAGSLVRILGASATNIAYVNLKSAGDLAIANSSNTNQESSNGTGGWVLNQPCRVDVQWTWATGTIAVLVRIFNTIESLIPSDSITATFAAANAPTQVWVGNATSTRETDYDSVRLYTGNSTWPLPLLPDGAAVLAPWAGDATQTTVEITSLTQGYGVLGLSVSTASDMSGATTYTAGPPDSAGWRKWSVTGLTANTQYYYQFSTSGSPVGGIYKFRTLRVAGTACTTKIAVGSCKQTAPSSTRAFNNIVTWAPDRVMNLGDMGYPNYLTPDPETHKRNWAGQVIDGGMLAIEAACCVDYIISDHDSNGHGPSNSPNFNDKRTIANLVAWADVVPARMQDARGTKQCRYRSEVEGNVRYIKLDNRSTERTDTRENLVRPDASTSTMLGAYQLGLLKADLTAAGTAGQFVVLFTDSCWNGLSPYDEAEGGIKASYSDKWPSYTYERDYISDWAAARIGNRMLIVYGDSHIIQQCDGTGTHVDPDGVTRPNEKNGFASICCGPFDQRYHAHYQEAVTYNYPAGIVEGTPYGFGQQYQRLTLAQVGSTLTVTCDAMDLSASTGSTSPQRTMTLSYTMP